MELANLIGLVQKRKPFHYVPVQPVIAFSHSLSSVALALLERWDDGVPKYIKIAYILYSIKAQEVFLRTTVPVLAFYSNNQ